LAVAVIDHPFLPKLLQRSICAGAADAQHLCQELLTQIEGNAAHAIMRDQ
jgi:hypothetical protein